MMDCFRKVVPTRAFSIRSISSPEIRSWKMILPSHRSG